MEEILSQLRYEARNISNQTPHFMDLAERYYADGKLELAQACLILLCRNCDNYEESIQWNELTEKWEKLRHLVTGLVPPSVSTTVVSPLCPEDCTMQIGEILELSDDNILSALSEHLGELSGNGEFLSSLNKWERTAFYIDELWTEVNSGGFDSYLQYYGLHFEKAYAALETVAATDVLLILNSIREKFPKKFIPKNEESLQNALDSMEEQGIDFESEDERFYTTGEKDLLKCLLSYLKEKQKHFR